MMNRWFAAVLCLTGTLLCAIPAGAQGVQTAVLTGATTSADGVALPGVTVTVSSPALQGERFEVTDVNGVYSIKGLPAGTYTATFDLANFKPARRDNVVLTVGGREYRQPLTVKPDPRVKASQADLEAQVATATVIAQGLAASYDAYYQECSRNPQNAKPEEDVMRELTAA